jgi:hypothetical protein
VYFKIGKWNVAKADAGKVIRLTLAEAGGAEVRASRDNTSTWRAVRVGSEFTRPEDCEQQPVLLFLRFAFTDKVGKFLGHISLL